MGGDGAGDVLDTIEQLFGSIHADTLTGDACANLLSGSDGDDILIGGAGKDTIEGGNGGDALIAGSSAYDSTQAPAREVFCEVLEDWAMAGHAFDSVMNATTLFDDAEVDNLYGQKGNDLFIMNISGGTILDISDATKTEEVFDLV